MILWTWGGWSMGMGWGYFVFMALIAAHFVWQLTTFDLKQPARGFYLFRANMLIGALLIAGAWLGALTA